MKNLLLTFFTLALCTPFLWAASSRFIARIPNPEATLAQAYDRTGYDIASYSPGSYLDLVLDTETYERLKLVHPAMFVFVTEQQMAENLSPASRDIPGYRNYSDFLNLLANLQTQYPGLLRVQYIGESWGKIYTQQGYSYYSNYQHDVIAIMLSDNADVDEDEPAFYFMGAHHAREPISTEVCLDILIHFLEGYNTDPRITDMINSSEIWFVPIVNPDGHRIVLTQTDIWWRKNIRDNNGNHTFQNDTYGYGLDGVDLNRNYGYEWGYTGSTDDFQHPTYHGLEAFSEPETMAIKDFLETRHFLGGISYHSYGELVLHPFGFISDLYAPDSMELSALGTQMANSIPSQVSGFYTPSGSWGLYPAAGSTDDWAYGNHGIFAYTIELATQFIPSASEIPIITQNNLEAAKLLIERKNRATLSGHIVDAVSSEPVMATVYIAEIDDLRPVRAPYKSNSAFGSYYRFLPVGTYTVNYFAEGFVAEQRTVQIHGDSVTIENVELIPSEIINLNIFVYDDNGYQITEALISFPDTEIGPVVSDLMGIASFSDFQAGSYRIRIEKNGYETLETYRQFLTPNIIFTLMESPMIWDDFENGVGSWTRTGQWGLSTNHAISGSYSLTDSPSGNYAHNGSSTCEYNQPINLQGLLYANLQFQIKHNLQLDGDYLALQISVNQQAWQSIDYFTGNSAWTKKSYSLNNYIGDNIRLRFRLITNSGGNADGVYIDDFALFMNTTPVTQNSPTLDTAMLFAYPNPFNGILNLRISNADTKADYSLDVYNVKGQHVDQVFSGKFTAPKSEIQWNSNATLGKKLASGIYFVRLTHKGKNIITKKILYLR